MTPSVAAPRFVAVADHALLVEFATEISDEANRAVVSLDRSLDAASISGLVEVVPAFVNLLVDFDPLVTDHIAVEAEVRAVLGRAGGHESTPRQHHIAVCFDHDLAADLTSVADAVGMSEQAVIDAHLAGDYRVAMYGFAPGYAYMAGVDERIRVPRKATPVRGVPAGSVIIAGPQCLITTLEMPTGWSVIGRSPTQVLRPEAESPFLFDPGDAVTFERVDRATYDRLMRR